MDDLLFINKGKASIPTLGFHRLLAPLKSRAVDQVCSIPTMDSDAVFKRKEILTHITKWMDLENARLSEIIQSQKDEYYMIPLT